MEKLNEIQQNLKCRKNQYNSFGNYNYRSCEDILEAVKPLLGEAILTITDEIVNIGDRYYIKATATLKDKDGEFSTTAYAREPLNKKGQDESQITGACSSYARKYALNGLFLIDDTKDADSMDNTQKTSQVAISSEKKANEKCTACGVLVHPTVANFSKSKMGKVLCRDCQKTNTKENIEENMENIINNKKDLF